MIATVVLARLLVPEDFGLVAMVTTFSLLVSNLGYNGFTEGILQRDDVTHRLASNVFWLNLGLGSILTVGFALFGPVLAWLYDNPRIEAVTTVVSLTILLSSSWVLHSALLKRAMRFSALSAIDVVARVTSVAVSIGLGAAGWGHWALVGGLLSIPLVTSAGVWTLCRWVPGRPRLDAETASFARFAIQVYGRFLVNYGSRNMDYLLVGVYFSAQSLGFYKKAYDLFALSSGQVVGPVTHVAVSALSRLRQAPQKYKLHLFGALKRFSDSPCTAWARRGTSACTNAGGPMQAYSMDLRERALLDSDAGMKAADVAVKYRVSGSWVRLLKQRRRETGEVAPRVQRHGRRRMLEPHLHTLAALIAEQPDRTLAELKDALGTPASLATIWRAVAALDVTVKKNGPALRTRST